GGADRSRRASASARGWSANGAFLPALPAFTSPAGAKGDCVHRVEKPWGYELWWARTDKYVGKLIHINKGHALSLQYHNKKDETIFVWQGKMLFEIGPTADALERREMGPGDVVHVTPPTVHRMTALEETDIFEVSTPEVEDVVRLEDRYGRQGT